MTLLSALVVSSHKVGERGVDEGRVGKPAGPPVVALIGPTAIGKSNLALQAAEKLDAVIVGVDAFTVYRQMTIGTAKPSAADRQRVDHRMIDRLDVEHDCTVQWFQGEARRQIDQAREQGHPALLVGGSGLYFRAVVDPLEFPPTDAVVRARIQPVVAEDPPAAHRQLMKVDPEAAKRMDSGNARRITRALEVIELTSRTFSSYRTAWEDFDSIYPGLKVIGLQVDREQLWARIESRVQQMLDAGWLEECRAMMTRDLSTSAAQAIGYAELFAHLADPASELSEVATRIAIRTRQFARRQARWFAGDPRVEWTDPDLAQAVLQRTLTARAT